MLFVLHTKMAQFNWEVAEELAFLEDPRQVKLLEASGGSLVPLPAHVAMREQCPLSLPMLLVQSQTLSDL